jgi:hypothetical protein
VTPSPRSSPASPLQEGQAIPPRWRDNTPKGPASNEALERGRRNHLYARGTASSAKLKNADQQVRARLFGRFIAPSEFPGIVGTRARTVGSGSWSRLSVAGAQDLVHVSYT